MLKGTLTVLAQGKDLDGKIVTIDEGSAVYHVDPREIPLHARKFNPKNVVVRVGANSGPLYQVPRTSIVWEPD